MLDHIFAQLGLNSRETQVYLDLLQRGAGTAGSLARRLSAPRSSIYADLARLEEIGMISRSEKGPVTRWHSEEPDKVNALLDAKINVWEHAKRNFATLLPSLRERQHADLVTPKVRFAEGIEGVRSVLNDMLNYRDLETEAFWPIQEMIEILGREFFQTLNTRRIRQNLYTRAIWPPERTVNIAEHPFLGEGSRFKREIRCAPADIDSSMGYWAYGNKVAFVSSTRESFGFIVESKEMRKMLKTQFEILWSVSTPIVCDDIAAARFLDKHGIDETPTKPAHGE